MNMEDGTCAFKCVLKPHSKKEATIVGQYHAHRQIRASVKIYLQWTHVRRSHRVYINI